MATPRRPITCTPPRCRRRLLSWPAAAALLLLALLAAAALLAERRRQPAGRGAQAGATAAAAAEPARSPGGRKTAAANRRPATAADRSRRRLPPATAPAAQPPLRQPGIMAGDVAALPPRAADEAADDTRRDGREPAVFAALRAGRGRPVPAAVAELARAIAAGCADDAARARAIYDWLTENIRYDVQEWAHITGGGEEYVHAHDPLSVLERGTTVCAGYAWLFNAMAESVGLNATFLIGDVRGYRGTADDELVSAFKHAWNAVLIDGRWRLLDATWGARQTGEADDASGLSRRDYYFDTPPRQMIFDHLPESPEWQLLPEPLPDESVFRSLPNLKPSFFTHGLRLGNAFADTLLTAPGEGGVIVVEAPEKVQVAATLGRLAAGAPAVPAPVLRNGTRHDIVVGPLAAGEYLLRVYSRAGEDERPFECSADFVVRVTTESPPEASP
jgi:hypothetical protein